MISIFHSHLVFPATFCLGLSLFTIPSAHAGCIVEGKVTLLPARNPLIDTSRYQLKAGRVAQPDPPSAVVFLSGVPPDLASKPPLLRVSQKGYQFTPGLIPVLKGTSIEFINEDDDYHQVFSLSKSKRFNLGRYRKEEKPAPIVFDTPGVVKAYCEIHEHMRSTILVLETPHFTKTDAQGNYRMENLPSGKYELKAWLDEKTVRTQTVTLEEGKAIKIDFTEH